MTTLATLAAGVALGCGPALATSPRPTAGPTAVASARADGAVPKDGDLEPRVGVSLELAPDAAAPAVRVRVTAIAPKGSLAVWSLAGGALSKPMSLRVRDARGPIEPSLTERDGRLVITLPREPEGELDVAYEIAARADTGDVRLDPARFRAHGEALLLLPDALEDRPSNVTLHVGGDAIGATGAASSFGVGASRELRVPLRELRTAAYLAGPLGHAIFDAYEGHDEAAWIGYTAFDPRWVAAEVATLRSAAGEYFHDKSPLPFTLLLVSERQRGAPFALRPRTRSLLVTADIDAPWSIAARVPVAHALVRRWIGAGVRLGNDDAAREAEGQWFTEGVARFVAREVLFASGTMTPDEYADEVNMLLGVSWTSPRRSETNEDLAPDGRDPAVAALLSARGALYATRADALVRRRSGGKRSLRDVLRGMLEEATTTKTALLPVEAWTSRLAAEIGADEARVFQDAIEGGLDAPLPDDALGPCFVRGKVRFEPFDLGFDAEGSASAGKLAGVRPDGPASRAGLRNGEPVVNVRGAVGKASSPVRVTVERDGREVGISYRPAGAARVGIGWIRRRSVPDGACVR